MSVSQELPHVVPLQGRAEPLRLLVVDEPLASLPLERTRPPREALDEIMEGLL